MFAKLRFAEYAPFKKRVPFESFVIRLPAPSSIAGVKLAGVVSRRTRARLAPPLSARSWPVPGTLAGCAHTIRPVLLIWIWGLPAPRVAVRLFPAGVPKRRSAPLV